MVWLLSMILQHKYNLKTTIILLIYLLSNKGIFEGEILDYILSPMSIPRILQLGLGPSNHCTFTRNTCA